MTRYNQETFIRRDGTVDTARAIRAGREERARAFHAGLAFIQQVVALRIGRAVNVARATRESAG